MQPSTPSAAQPNLSKEPDQLKSTSSIRAGQRLYASALELLEKQQSLTSSYIQVLCLSLAGMRVFIEMHASSICSCTTLPLMVWESTVL